jgi:hypothetical protein
VDPATVTGARALETLAKQLVVRGGHEHRTSVVAALDHVLRDSRSSKS